MSEDVVLVNLETGERINVDYYQLMDRGIPDGYVVANHLSVDEWIEALRKALNDRGAP